MKPTSFDCVEMMHDGAELVRSKIEGVTRQEEVEFWRRATLRLEAAQKKASEKKRRSDAT